MPTLPNQYPTVLRPNIFKSEDREVTSDSVVSMKIQLRKFTWLNCFGREALRILFDLSNKIIYILKIIFNITGERHCQMCVMEIVHNLSTALRCLGKTLQPWSLIPLVKPAGRLNDKRSSFYGCYFSMTEVSGIRPDIQKMYTEV